MPASIPPHQPKSLPGLSSPTPARSASFTEDRDPSDDDQDDEPSTGSGTPTAQEILDRDGPTRYGPRKRRKISRSKAGCLACRKRKKACDMARPVCGSCVKLSRDCEWPSTPTPASSSLPPPSGQNDVGGVTSVSTVPNSIHEHRGRPPRPETHGSVATSAPPDGVSSTQSGPFDLPPLIDSFTPSLPNSMLTASVHDAWLMDLMSVGSGSGNASADMHGMSGTTGGHGGGGGDRSTSMTDDLWDPAMWCNLFEPAPDPLNVAMSSHGQHPNGPADLSPLATSAPLQPSAASIADTILWSQVETSFPSPFPSLPGHPATEPHPYIYLASRSSSISQIAPCLREALLAVAAHILTVQDNPRFEMISRRKESAAETTLVAKLGDWQMGTVAMWSDEERWGLMATVLVMMQLKRLRGDVYAYERYIEALRGMHVWAENAPDARALYIYEQVAMHDLLSTVTYRQGMSVNYQSPNFARRGYIFPLTGITLPLFPLIKRVQDLIARRRAIPDITWDDDQHLDVVEAADAMLDALKEEKKCMDRLITAQPHLATNRFLHESFRTAFLLHIRSYVLSHAPCTIDIGLLVRQNLSLLETMVEQRLPGLGLVHWVIFITAVHCIPSKGKKHNDERVRAMKLYEAVKSENIGQLERTKRIVQEVWHRNQGGQVPVDWMAIADDWDWELFFL